MDAQQDDCHRCGRYGPKTRGALAADCHCRPLAITAGRQGPGESRRCAVQVAVLAPGPRILREAIDYLRLRPAGTAALARARDDYSRPTLTRWAGQIIVRSAAMMVYASAAFAMIADRLRRQPPFVWAVLTIAAFEVALFAVAANALVQAGGSERVSGCSVTTGPQQQMRVTHVEADGPAAGKLRVGDVVQAVDGRPSWSAVLDGSSSSISYRATPTRSASRATRRSSTIRW